MNATVIMVSQGATALGSIVWGTAAAASDEIPAFLVAGVLAILAIVFAELFLQKRVSVDFTAGLNLEPAAVTIFSHDLDPMRLSQVKDNPVSIVAEFEIDPAHRAQCIKLMREVRLIYLRNGARNWHLYEDLIRSHRFQMEVVASSWNEYRRQRHRFTGDEKDVLDKLDHLRIDPYPSREFIRVSADKEVMRSRALAPDSS